MDIFATYKIWGLVMDCIVSLKNSHVKALTPNMSAFSLRSFREEIKVKLGNKCGTLIQLDWCSYKKRDTRDCCLSECTGERPCEDIATRWPITSQKESPHQKSSLLHFDHNCLHK